jgi:hypothetical protein
MAHYAFLDDSSIVIEVIVGIDETELIQGLDPETWYGNFRGKVCKRTSYNEKIRFNFAQIGFSYDPAADAFIPPKPFDSWKLSSDFKWESPVPYPKDGKVYLWNEKALKWDLIS